MTRKILLLNLIIAGIFLAGAGCLSFSSSKTATSGPTGMFLSTDKGETWKQIAALPTVEGVKSISGVDVYQVAVDPQDADALYLASRKNGLFYTYDGGSSWQKTVGALGSGFIYSVAVHPKNKCEIYATNGQQVFRSDDCNRSWKEMYREARADVFVTSLAFNYYPPYQVYLAESNGDLLQSVDGGASWEVLQRFKTRLAAVAPSRFDKNLLYVVTRTDGLYRSDDGGGSWVPLREKMSKFSSSLEYRRYLLHPADANTVYWISTYGILVSNDRGDNWQALKLITPPGGVNIYSFAINPKNDKEIYYTATINERSTFYKSVDGGNNWITKKLPSGQLPTVLRVHPEKDSWLYLGFSVPPENKTQPAFFGQ